MGPLSNRPMPFDPFKDEPTKKRSQKQEKKIEKTTGGSRQPGSGAFPTHKGDVKATLINKEKILIESKTTKRKSHAMSIDNLVKISNEAIAAKRSPAYWVTFENMPYPYEKDWVAVPASLLEW